MPTNGSELSWPAPRQSAIQPNNHVDHRQFRFVPTNPVPSDLAGLSPACLPINTRLVLPSSVPALPLRPSAELLFDLEWAPTHQRLVALAEKFCGDVDQLFQAGPLCYQSLASGLRASTSFTPANFPQLKAEVWGTKKRLAKKLTNLFRYP